MPKTSIGPGRGSVKRRHDDWIEVPAKTALGVSWSLKLRPGADDGKLRFDPSATEVEVDIDQLREGLDLVEEEHQR